MLILLLSNAVALRRDKSILYNRTTSIMFILMFYVGLNCLNLFSLSNTISLYGGLFSINSTSYIFQIFIFGLTAIILGLSAIYSRSIYGITYRNIKDYSNNVIVHNSTNDSSKSSNLKKLISAIQTVYNYKTEQYKIIEYPLIILFIVIGATFLISSNDIVSLFISIELQSYGLYLLAVLYRNSELSTNAGLTYFLLGGLSSCFILLGSALLYTNSGTTNLELLYIINKIWDSSKNYVLYSFETGYIGYALVVMVVGFLFKISAAPFHFWSPDVYDAIHTIVTTFVAIIPKISILTFIYSIVHYTSNTLFTADFDWRYILVISSLLSLIVGTVLGLTQSRIKRLYAYSTISHLGFILLALSINNIESTQAFMFYLMQYSLSNLNAFILLLIIGYSLYKYNTNKVYNDINDENNSPIQLISQLKGYFEFNPIIAISLAITIYSFVGVPPLLGFFAKQMVLSAALDNGFVFMSLIAILTSVISAVYYLSIIKQIFFDKFNYTISNNYSKILEIYPVKLSSIHSISISLLTLIILLFILQPQEWLSSTSLMSLLSFNP